MVYFILGTNLELCLAELRAVLGDRIEIVYTHKHVVLANLQGENLGALQERLSGVVKTGHIIGEMTQWNNEDASALIATYASGAMGKNKISYGVSVYDVGGGAKTLEGELNSLGGAIKKILKELGRPVRYVTGKEPRLSSAIIETNGILSSGGEYVLLSLDDKILIGQTESVQDFRAWEARDMGRPAKDRRSGILPPKLARLMINLSGVNPEGATLLDPFCGSGTVLMEGILMGFKNLIASDISEKATADTQANLSWLVDAFDLSPPNLAITTTAAADFSLETPVDTIVTEVFLGEPRRETADAITLKKIETALMPMFRASFINLRQYLTPEGTAVVAFPAYRKKDGTWHRLPLPLLLEAIGYDIQTTHLYHRPGQYVARDIYVLTRK